MNEVITKEIVDDAGGPAAVARQFKIRTWAVCKWKQVPSERVATVCRMANKQRGYRKWEPEMVRPDIFQSI